MEFLKSIWAIPSLVLIAWVTQRITKHFDRKKKIEETKLALFMSWMPFFAECHANASEQPEKPLDRFTYAKKKMEILGILQIMGPTEGLEAGIEFFTCFEKMMSKDEACDLQEFHEAFTNLNDSLCSDIHQEPHVSWVDKLNAKYPFPDKSATKTITDKTEK